MDRRNSSFHRDHSSRGLSASRVLSVLPALLALLGLLASGGSWAFHGLGPGAHHGGGHGDDDGRGAASTAAHLGCSDPAGGCATLAVTHPDAPRHMEAPEFREVQRCVSCLLREHTQGIDPHPAHLGRSLPEETRLPALRLEARGPQILSGPSPRGPPLSA